jgi:antitoxin component YwqK of YwqJK toxin-antitoxin module
MLRYFLFSIIVLISQHTILACSCNCFKTDVPVEEIDGLIIKKKDAKKNSALIFEGTLIKSEIKGDKFELSFEIQRYYKGQEASTQIKILTSRGDCGFKAKTDSKCLIFAYEYNGSLHTYSSQCCRSVVQEQEETKYTQYKRFLELIVDKPDGTYQFKRFKADGYSCKAFNKEVVPELNLQFTIKNHQLDGEWLLYHFDGTILEKGSYKKGLRSGAWTLGSKKIRFAAVKPD